MPLNEYKEDVHIKILGASLFNHDIIIWLVVWNIFIFPYIYIQGIIIPIDFHIFSEGLKPPASNEIKGFPMENHQPSPRTPGKCPGAVP